MVLREESGALGKVGGKLGMLRPAVDEAEDIVEIAFIKGRETIRIGLGRQH